MCYGAYKEIFQKTDKNALAKNLLTSKIAYAKISALQMQRGTAIPFAD